MNFSVYPDYSFEKIEQVTPDFLRKEGIGLLMLDLDNTLAPYGDCMPKKSVLDWCDSVKKSGICVILVSNNRTLRPMIYSNVFGVDYVDKACKPFPWGVKKAIAKSGVAPENAALCGDQIFTDILAANFCGIRGILVSPIRLRNPFHMLRYILELPFRGKTKTGR